MSALEGLTAATDAAELVVKAAQAKVADAEKACADAGNSYDGSEWAADRREQLETVLRRARWDLDLATKKEDAAIVALNAEQDLVWAAEAARLQALASDDLFWERATPILARFVARDNAARADIAELQQVAREQATAGLAALKVEGLRGRHPEAGRTKSTTTLQSYVGVSIFIARERGDHPTAGLRCVDTWISGFSRPAWNGDTRDQWNLIERTINERTKNHDEERISKSNNHGALVEQHRDDPRLRHLDECDERSAELHGV